MSKDKINLSDLKDYDTQKRAIVEGHSKNKTNKRKEENLKFIKITKKELDTEKFTFNSKNIKFNKKDISQYFNIDLDEKFLFKYEFNKKKQGNEVTSMQTIMLPKDTRENFAFAPSQNFALEVNKLARFELTEKQKEKFIVRQDDGIKKFFNEKNYEFVRKHIEQITKSYKDLGYIFPKEPIKKSIDWRLIVGLGNESVYETSMTLHHIYGIPYIPGSAVKGVTRSYVISEILSPLMRYKEGEEEKTEHLDVLENLLEIEDLEKLASKKDEDIKKALKTRDNAPSEILIQKVKDKQFPDELIQAKKIFGKQNHQGQLIFFDAFPTSAPKIEPDIMNPHYGDYYSGKTDNNNNPIPPADYLSPNPIFFLTVKGAEFDFYLGMKPKHYNENKALLDKAEDWLKKALTTHGIGAKTAVGYGYFN